MMATDHDDEFSLDEIGTEMNDKNKAKQRGQVGSVENFVLLAKQGACQHS